MQRDDSFSGFPLMVHGLTNHSWSNFVYWALKSQFSGFCRPINLNCSLYALRHWLDPKSQQFTGFCNGRFTGQHVFSNGGFTA